MNLISATGGMYGDDLLIVFEPASREEEDDFFACVDVLTRGNHYKIRVGEDMYGLWQTERALLNVGREFEAGVRELMESYNEHR